MLVAKFRLNKPRREANTRVMVDGDYIDGGRKECYCLVLLFYSTCLHILLVGNIAPAVLCDVSQKSKALSLMVNKLIVHIRFAVSFEEFTDWNRLRRRNIYAREIIYFGTIAERSKLDLIVGSHLIKFVSYYSYSALVSAVVRLAVSPIRAEFAGRATNPARLAPELVKTVA